MSAGWLVDALIASALLMGVVMLVRVPVRRSFGPTIAYALWALPLVRLVLPPLPAAWREAAATPITRAGETITVLVIDPAGSAAAAPVHAAPLLGSPLWLWALGAAAFLLFHLVRHARFCRRIVARALARTEVEGVTVMVSAAAPGPLAFGIVRRFVAFPADFAERYDEEEQALALAHEMGHHRRGDLVANWAGLVVLALHWWNPLAWRAYRAFRADQELANDAGVLAEHHPALRHAYGRAIVKAAHGGAVSAACHLHTIDDLKGRLKMLARSPASRRRLRTGIAAVAATVLAGLGLTASGTEAAAAISEKVGDAVGVDLPQVPVPPAPPAPDAVSDVPSPPAPPPAPSGKARKHVVVVKDGKTAIYEGPEADRIIAENGIVVPPVPPVPLAPLAPGTAPHAPNVTRTFTFRQSQVTRDDKGNVRSFVINIPEVHNQRCPGAATRPVIEHSEKDGKQRIVICTNRIEAMTENAQKVAMNSVTIEREARISARAGLGTARAAIERDRNLTDDQRREALEGIAKAEAELNDAK